MPSARPSRRFRKGCLFLSAGIAAVFLVFYIFLVSGGLEGLVRFIVHRIPTGEGTVVSVYGSRSNLFSSTSVDSVIVTNDRDLKVAVHGATVRGSVFSFLFSRQVETITVDSLIIRTPMPSGEPPDSSLSPIFTGTVAGIVTRAEKLELSYGRIVDHDGVLLVDSMFLAGSIPDIGHATVNVAEASSSIPILGKVRGSGVLRVDSLRTELEDFTLSAPPGSISVAGTLDADSTFEFSVSGTASSAFLPELPYGVVSFTGMLAGSIPEPHAELSIDEGCINYDGLMIGLTAETIRVWKDSCSFSGILARTGGVSAGVSGGMNFADFSWACSLALGLQSTNIASYFPELPSTDVTGMIFLNGSGAADRLSGFEVNSSFSNTGVMNYRVSEMSFRCSGDPSFLSGELSALVDGGNISSSFYIGLGGGYQPVSWQADISGFLADCGVLTPGAVSPLDYARGLSVDMSGEGSMSAFTSSGTLGLSSYNTDSLQASDLRFRGRLSSGSSGMSAAGNLSLGGFLLGDSAGLFLNGLDVSLELFRSQENIQAECSLLVAEAGYAGMTADSVMFDGMVTHNGGISGTGELAVRSVLLGGNPYSLSAGFAAEPGFVMLDSLSIGAPGNLELGLSGLLSYEQEKLGFSVNGIAVTRSGKLRLISAGNMEMVSDSSGVVLDTLWLDLPSGEIIAEGWLRGDSVSVFAGLQNVDIASLTAMLGLSVPLSGILEADVSLAGAMGSLKTEIDLVLDHPTYDQWDNSDSVTVNISSQGDSLLVDGIWSWSRGIRSGLRMGFDGIWTEENTIGIELPNLMWLEAELTGIGDELFYLLPMPLKTNGASVSARIEYQRDSQEFTAGVASYFNRLYLTDPGIEFPGISLYMTYPQSLDDSAYNGSLIFNSNKDQRTTLEGSVFFDMRENFTFDTGSLPLELKGYSMQAVFDGWETLVAGVGWLKISGVLNSRSSNPAERPMATGKLNIDAATISMAGGGAIEGSAGSSSSGGEMPLDLNIRITGDRGIWFRNSYANVELSTDISLTTVRNQLVIGGDVRAVRGGVYLLGREFRITQGEVRILQSIPLGIELDIEAGANVRSTVSGAEYTITVLVTGDPESPEITLTGSGPSGAVSQQDIVTLLTAGMTYGELQQFDSTALSSVAGNYLGQWLAGSIRDDVGLDALQFTPDFSDTTSLIVNAGKYVLPDLFVSFSSDVFSSDAGTVRAQYFINRDFFLEGSTKSTLTGSHDPSLELHYTYRY